MEIILHQLIWQINISHYLQGFIHPRCCRMSSINSMNQHIEFTKNPPQTYHAGHKVVNIYILNNTVLWSRLVFGSSQRLSATTRMVKSGYCCGQPATLALIGAHLQRRRLERAVMLCHQKTPWKPWRMKWYPDVAVMLDAPHLWILMLCLSVLVYQTVNAGLAARKYFIQIDSQTAPCPQLSNRNIKRQQWDNRQEKTQTAKNKQHTTKQPRCSKKKKEDI